MLMNVAERDVPVPTVSCEALQVSPVDLKHLRRYTMGDHSLEKEILGLFLGQLPQTIKALSEATTDQDWRIAAHTLKGSGRAVGAWRVARLAELAERQFNTSNRALCSQAVERIEEAAEEARMFIELSYPASGA
jgi:HPt (histidine-containing phosphotransfer) domain-containing protein